MGYKMTMDFFIYYFLVGIIVILFFAIMRHRSGEDITVTDLKFLILFALLWPIFIMMVDSDTVLIKGKRK